MVKEVNISETILKEYKEKEIVHYLAKTLKKMDTTYRAAEAEWALSNYGAMLTDIAHLSAIATALDKKMNKDTQDPSIVL